MFDRNKTEKSKLDEAIDELFDELKAVTADSDEYAKTADQLVKLHNLKEPQAPKRVSPDTWATIIANLAGITLILQYERAAIVTSKAIGFIQKLR